MSNVMGMTMTTHTNARALEHDQASVPQRKKTFPPPRATDLLEAPLGACETCLEVAAHNSKQGGDIDAACCFRIVLRAGLQHGQTI